MSNVATPRDFLPMETAGTQHFIERTYREGGPFQWVRETYKNAEEAGATRIEFGVEWQAVENRGVYRRVIADNGSGMNDEELVEFFNTFGGGGKPIGDAHENFGVGAKTSLLPWNRHGMVVVSWVDGEPAMIWVQRHPETGEYGLAVQEVIDPDTGEVELEGVFTPYEDDDHGCNWAAIKPSWIKDHGTVIVLLGDDPAHDTVLGDPSRDESDIKGISTYTNRRAWEIDEDVKVQVDELRTQDRSEWPTSAEMAHGPAPKSGVDRRTNKREIRGAKFFIEYPMKSFKAGKLAHSGVVPLSDGTKVNWFLWEGERPAVQSYAAKSGYVGALYKNELYDVGFHQATYRSFGITEPPVRRNTWLIIEPPLLDEGEGKYGVYPRTDRNALLLRGGPHAGGPLPYYEWAAEFADNMPDEILDAIKKARAEGGGSITDPKWRDRLADRFGKRWRIPRLRTRQGGKLTVDPTQVGSRPVKAKHRRRRKGGTGGGTGGRSGQTNTGSSPGSRSAVKTTVAGGVPNFRFVGEDEVGAGMVAAWNPNDPTEPDGVVLVNASHPVLQEQVENWQSQYPDHLADEIAQEVLNAYGEIAAAKIAHSEHLKGDIPAQTIEKELRSDAALTMALLGLMAEEAVIAPRIGGKYRRRPEAAATKQVS